MEGVGIGCSRRNMAMTIICVAASRICSCESNVSLIWEKNEAKELANILDPLDRFL